MRKVTRLLPMGLALLSASCASSGLTRCRLGETRMVVETLYFGTERPGGVVTAQEWEQFLGEELTSRFPDGLTVIGANGQWRDRKGEIEKEHSHVVQVVHPDSPAKDAAIRAVVDGYKHRFQQEAVMRVRGTSCVSF